MATESENVFERYLNGQNIAWQKFPESNRKHPDYQVEYGRTTCLFEIKEFEDPAIKPSTGFSPCPAIQEKLTQARKQFRFWRQHCCALVLWNSKSIYRSVFTDAVGSAAFGKYVLTDSGPPTNLRADPPRYRFSGPAELRPNVNSTISAIVILGPYRLNHLWLEMWRVLHKKQKDGEEITPRLQFEVLQQLSEDKTVHIVVDGGMKVWDRRAGPTRPQRV